MPNRKYKDYISDASNKESDQASIPLRIRYIIHAVVVFMGITVKLSAEKRITNTEQRGARDE